MWLNFDRLLACLDPETTQIRGPEAAKMGENSWDLIEEDVFH